MIPFFGANSDGVSSEVEYMRYDQTLFQVLLFLVIYL